MAEYSWTIQLGAWRMGWIKYNIGNPFYERQRGYIRFGHLDFYNSKTFR